MQSGSPSDSLSVSSPSIMQPKLVPLAVCHCFLNLIRCQLVNSDVRQSATKAPVWGLRRRAETQSSPGATVLNREEGHRITTSTTTGCMMSWAMLIPCRLYGYLPIIYSFTSANVLPKTTPTSWRRPQTSFDYNSFCMVVFPVIMYSIWALNVEFSLCIILYSSLEHCKAKGSNVFRMIW